MGRLFDAIQQLDAILDERGLDKYKFKGEIGFEAGFFIALVQPGDADDPSKLEALKSATDKILGVQLNV